MSNHFTLEQINARYTNGNSLAKIAPDSPIDEPIFLDGGKINGSLLITNRTFEDEFTITGANIAGNLVIEKCIFKKPFSLRGTKINGTLSIKECFFQSTAVTDLCDIETNSQLNIQNTKSTSPIDLSGSSFTQSISINNIETKILTAERVNTGSFLSITQNDSYTKCAFTRISLANCTFNGNVTLKGILLQDPDDSHVLLDLEHTHVSGSLFIDHGTLLGGGADLRSFIKGQLTITQTIINNSVQSNFPYSLCMANARIGESVLIIECILRGQILIQSSIGNSLIVRRSILRQGFDNVALKMAGAIIKKYFSIESSIIEGSADITSVKAEGFSLSNSRIRTRRAHSTFSLRDANFRSRLSLTKSRIRQFLNLSVKVGADTVFDNVSISCKQDDKNVDAVSFWGAKISGTLFLMNGTSIHGNIDLFNAQIGGGILTTDSHSEPERELPEADGILCQTNARRLANPNLNILGKLRLDYAKISGPCLIYRTQISEGLSALSVTVKGDFHLCNCILGQSRESAGQFLTEDASAVDLEMADISGRLWMKSSDLFGSLCMDGVCVGNEINLEFGRIFGNLRMREASVRGRCFSDEMSTLSFCPLTTGEIDLSFSAISQMDLRFSKEGKHFIPRHINLSMANIDTLRIIGDSQLDCTDETRRGSIDTNGFIFRDLSVNGGVFSVRRMPINFDIIRMTIWIYFLSIVIYTAITAGDASLNLLIIIYFTLTVVQIIHSIADGRTAFSLDGKRRNSIPELDLLDHTSPFNRGFFLAVEKWFRESGFNEIADEVFLMRRRRESGMDAEVHETSKQGARALRSWKSTERVLFMATKPWVFFSDFSFGFGVRYHRLIHLFILLFLLNIGIFIQRDSVERPLSYIQPSSTIEPGKSNSYWEADGGVPKNEEWKFTNAFFMSLRVQVPIIAIGSENDWEPSSRPIFGEKSIISRTFTFEEWANLTSIINFILIPMILAGLSRQFRSREN